mgnify:CR=1 FL=1
MPGGFSHMLRGVLRPLVKAMIAKGVTAPAVYRLLKEVFVEVAKLGSFVHVVTDGALSA